jgi:hypothetical protein
MDPHAPTNRKIFTARIKEITDAISTYPKYKIEYSPVNAGAKCRCTMIKVFTNQEDKEEMRKILKEANSKLQLHELIPEIESKVLPCLRDRK